VRTGDSRNTRQSATDKSNTISTSTSTRAGVYACTRPACATHDCVCTLHGFASTTQSGFRKSAKGL